LYHLRKAAEAGYATAMYRLAAQYYEHGNTKEAIYWGKKTTEQHHNINTLHKWLFRLDLFEEYVDELIRNKKDIDFIIRREDYKPPLAHKYFTGRAYALKLIDWFDADLEEFYHTVFDGAQTATLCWMWVAKQLRVGRDVARLIGEKVFATRKTHQGLWLGEKREENKRQKV
jgi:hypothetical protein